MSLVVLDRVAQLGSPQARRPCSMADRDVVLPFDEAVAITWGHLQARAQLRGRPRPMNDSWIAACCLIDRIPLATFNGKDFADFAEYDGLRLFDVS